MKPTSEDRSAMEPPRLPVRAARIAIAAMTMNFVALMVVFTSGPIRFATLPLALASLGLTIAALVMSRSVEKIAVLRVMLAMGGGLSILLALLGTGLLLLAPEISAYDDCLSTAITHKAQAACTDEFNEAAQAKIDALVAVQGG